MASGRGAPIARCCARDLNAVRTRSASEQGGIEMRILVTLTVLALSASACGENPHLLAGDPSIQTPVTRPDGGGHEPGKGDNGKGKQGGKKDCSPKSILLTQFQSRALSPTLFETQLVLPPRSHFVGVESATLWLTGPETMSADAAAGASVCLLDANICAGVDSRNGLSLDLVNHFQGQDFEQILYNGPALRWQISADLGVTDAVLQIEMVKCDLQ
jgi:hypothetical protein